MDFTPFATSVEGQSRITLKVPCEVDASPKIRVVTGGTSNLHTLNIKNAFIKGTLDGNKLWFYLSWDDHVCNMQNYLMV
jgi:hypothetical protein